MSKESTSPLKGFNPIFDFYHIWSKPNKIEEKRNANCCNVVRIYNAKNYRSYTTYTSYISNNQPKLTHIVNITYL